MTDEQRLAIAILDKRGFFDVRTKEDGTPVPLIGLYTRSNEHIRLLSTLHLPSHIRHMAGRKSVAWRNDDALCLGAMIAPYIIRKAKYLAGMLALCPRVPDPCP